MVEIDRGDIETASRRRHEQPWQRVRANQDIERIGLRNVGCTELPHPPARCIDPGIDRPVTVERAASGIDRSRHDRLERIKLAICHPATQALQREAAALVGVDDAILVAVESITGLQDCARNKIEILPGQRLRQALASIFLGGDLHEPSDIPGLRDGRSRQAEPRISRDDAIEIGWIPLGGDHRLASAVGAPHEHRSDRRAAIVRLDQPFGSIGDLADSGIGKVQPRLLIERERGVAPGVPSVHADDGIAACERRHGVRPLQRNRSDRRCDKAIHTAAALEEELPVPLQRRPQLEANAVGAAYASTMTDPAFDQAVRAERRVPRFI